MKAHLVFINDQFTLYGSPLHKPILHPSQLQSHFRQLNFIKDKITDKHRRLAKLLLSLHMNSSPFTQLPTYEYSELNKGVLCRGCNGLSTYIVGRKCICEKCACKEPVENAVMRSVREFQLLFPDKKITSRRIHDWCKITGTQKWIRNILKRNMQQKGRNRWAYYE